MHSIWRFVGSEKRPLEIHASFSGRPTEHELFPHDRDDEISSTGPHIALQEKDLLPGSEDRRPVVNGHGERRAQPRGLEMRVPVSIVPCLLVPI